MILKQDSNGVKPLLAAGELGYDKYPAGGDEGRVWVGTGAANLALAKKEEVTTHITNISNPHGVTKAQVGLGNVDNTSDASKPVSTATQTTLNLKANIASPTFTGTVTAPTFVGAFTGNVSTSTKLVTARTIGGVSFDGSANINLPGVNTVGNQNTTGTAAGLTATRTINGTSFNGTANITTGTWGTARNIQVGSTSKSVSGSGDVSWTTDEIGAVSKTSNTGSAKLPSGTIAQRDAAPIDGMIRYNTETLGFEGAINSSWQSLGSGYSVEQVDLLLDTKVSISDAQIIGGVKTFTSSPIVPTPTTSTQVANKSYVDIQFNNGLGKQGYSFIANATFTSTDNKIVMTGIVSALGLEVGDVITFSNANASNNKPHTVESITDNNTIVVNYEHCSARGNGSLKLYAQTVTNASCKLLAKWFVASDGLGQDWVNLTTTRVNLATYTNNLNRTMKMEVVSNVSNAQGFALWEKGSRVMDLAINFSGVSGYISFCINHDVSPSSYFYVEASNTITVWRERR